MFATPTLDKSSPIPLYLQLAGRLETLYAQLAQWQDVAVIDPGDLAPDLVADRVMALAAEGHALLAAGDPS